MYLLWSYLPTPFLHQLGIYYYPDRWWSLAIPAWLVMVVVYIFVALAAYNTGSMTLGMGDLGCLVDEKSDVAVVDGRGRLIRVKRAGITEEKEKEVRGKGHSREKSAKVDHRADDREGHELDWKTLWNEGTDAVMDVPLGGVCEILYGSSRESDEDEDDDDFYD
jgi:phosphatidylinositol glycan class P protein